MRLPVALLLPALTLCGADKPLTIVLVIDGLRPDSITADGMPNLAKLKQEGTWAENSHSVFPTVTRVNSTTIGTGTTPAVHGIVSNTMYVPGVSEKVFDTADYENLLKLAEISGGRTVPVQTLGEALQKAGIPFVAMGSGSTGAAFLLNPMATKGIGVLINGSLDGGKRAAYPDKVDQEIRKRFGIQKADVGTPSVLWAEKVLREYVLAELKPKVIIDWVHEPDSTQHRYGPGSPEALAVLKMVDGEIGLLVAKLAGKANIIVTADHGFGSEPDPVDLTGGLKASGQADKVRVANNGASSLLFVKNHEASAIRAITQQLQETDGVDLIFTNGVEPGAAGVKCDPGKEEGFATGTLALELVNQCNAAHGADIIVTFQWSSDKNPFGMPGLQRIASAEQRKGVPGRAGHGGLNPFMVHTPLILWGPSFRKNAIVHAPAANSDIAPTILAIEELKPLPSMTGRVIAEALAKPATKEPEVKTRSVKVSTEGYCAQVQLTTTGKTTYIDSGQRCN
jgi:predicted AlkP superfamily pyrophosphatase or phosphodiesterase